MKSVFLHMHLFIENVHKGRTDREDSLSNNTTGDLPRVLLLTCLEFLVMRYRAVKLIFLGSVILLALLSPDMGLAQEPPMTVFDPIVVTGSAHSTQPNPSTQSVTILQAEQASPFQLNRVVNLLQQVPGLHVDETGGRSGISSLYLRGADPNFTLIMVDGIPINDSTNQRGGSVDLSTIPLDRLERVEIVRGPLSAFYGSEAMAGAVNFITTSYSQDPSVRLLGAGGRFDYMKGIIQGGGATGPLSGRISFSHTQQGEQVEKDRFLMSAVGGHASYQPHPAYDFRLTGQYTDSTVRSFPEGSGGPLLAFLQETERRSTQEVLAGFAASILVPSDWRHHFFISVTQRVQDVSNPGVLSAPDQFQIPPARFHTRYHRLQTRLTETWTISPQWKLSLGSQLTHERGTRDGTQDLSSFGGPQMQPLDFTSRRTWGGLYSEVTWTQWESFILNTGIRMDISQGFQPKVSPRIGIAYQILPTLNVRGGYGKGFKLPSLSSLNDPQIGNPTLQPETSQGWDVGLEYHTSNRTFEGTVEYFHNRFRQLIDLDPELLSQGIFRLANIEEATTQGWNASLTFAPLSQLSVQTTLTYLITEVTDTGAPLRNRPKWRGGIGVGWQLSPKFDVRGQVNWVSSRLDFQIPTQTTRVGGYTKLDITLNYYPLPEWHGYVILENVTNASYQEYRGFPSPPLTVRIGLEYRLN